jgi:hypothetical protein
MDLFSSFFVVAATASATEANESTEETSDAESFPRSWADVRRCFHGSAADALAFTISALTSPFLVCTVMAGALAAKLAPSWREIVLWGGLAAVSAGVVPFGVVHLLLRRGNVSDYHVAQRERRWAPLGAAILSGVLALISLHLLRTPTALQALAGAYLVSAAAFTLISLRWKISLHAAAYSGALAACALVASPWWWAGLAAVPFLVWARTRRGRHTIAQGVVGAGLGAGLVALTYGLVAGF